MRFQGTVFERIRSSALSDLHLEGRNPTCDCYGCGIIGASYGWEIMEEVSLRCWLTDADKAGRSYFEMNVLFCASIIQSMEFSSNWF